PEERVVPLHLGDVGVEGDGAEGNVALDLHPGERIALAEPLGSRVPGVEIGVGRPIDEDPRIAETAEVVVHPRPPGARGNAQGTPILSSHGARRPGAAAHPRSTRAALRAMINSRATTGRASTTTCRQSATETMTYANRSLISVGTWAYRDQTRRAKSRL